MRYFLIDNPNASAQSYWKSLKINRDFWGYPTRRNPIRAVVLHTAENLPDYDPPDSGAEAVARYGATTDRSASWHCTVDSDSTIWMLPDDYTAFHVRGYNSQTLGIEMAGKAANWTRAPADWVALVIDRAAAVCAEWAKRHGIPIRRITKTQLDRGEKGFISHAALDPTRRSDPGGDFPWPEFLTMVDEFANDDEGDDDMKIENTTWDAWFGAGLIQGDPNYYKSGRASTDEVNHAVNVALAELAARTAATAGNITAGTVISGTFEGVTQ